jgi:hypothetical protein
MHHIVLDSPQSRSSSHEVNPIFVERSEYGKTNWIYCSRRKDGKEPFLKIDPSEIVKFDGVNIEDFEILDETCEIREKVDKPTLRLYVTPRLKRKFKQQILAVEVLKPLGFLVVE